MLSAGDFATAVADHRGHVIGMQLPPGFTCAFTRVLEGVLRKWDGNFEPGDVIVCNDPNSGASHKPDVFVVMPLFLGEQLAGFSLAYSHQGDVGGRFAGGISSRPTTTFEEGLHLPAVKLYERNVLNDALADLLRSNIRAGDEFLADIEAKIEAPKIEAIAPMPGTGGGTGRDGTTGTGPGSGGGVGTGIGTGRGSGIGSGTGGGSQANYPPSPTELFIPPLPMPDKVRGFHLVAEYDVDSTGKVVDFNYTHTRDGGYNKRLEEVLKSFKFRPGTTPDGKPIRMKAQIVYDF